MKEYYFKRYVKDPHGEKWRWLFGEWVYTVDKIELFDDGNYLKSKGGDIFQKCNGGRIVAKKKDRFFSKVKGVEIYEVNEWSYNNIVPNWEKGFPPTTMI